MDSRDNRSSSQSQVHHRSPNPDPNPNPNPQPNPAATMMGGDSTSTSQSPPHRLTSGALSLPNPQPQHQTTLQLQQQQMVQRTPDSRGFGDGRGIESPRMVRRRGRPRKNRGDGNVAPTLPLFSASSSHGGGNATSSDPPAKRGRGRPRGSKKKQPEADAIGASDGIGFIPHIVNVKSGEDIATKLREFSVEGPRTICILSGKGTVGKVTLRHRSSLSGITAFEGQYEILTLSGSFLNSEVNGTVSRLCSLNVVLAGNDGKVIGGGVIGALVAATDVEVVVGSFLMVPKKQKKSSGSQPEGSLGEANVVNPFASPRSQGPSCDSTGNNESTSHPLQPGNSNRGTSSGHSAPQEQEQQQRQQQQQQEEEQQQQ